MRVAWGGYTGSVKKFKFRYQTLLEVRERQQKTEEEKFQRLMGELAARETERERLEAEKQALWESWKASQQAEQIDLDALMTFQQYAVGLDQLIERQARLVAEAHERTEAQRQVLAAAMRDVRIVAELKEKDERQWREALERAEDQLIDELAMARYARNPGGLAGS